MWYVPTPGGGTKSSKHEQISTDGKETFGMLNHKVANTYRQLFSPVMTQTVMFILWAIAVSNKEFIYIADVKGAFLYALLLAEEQVYC